MTEEEWFARACDDGRVLYGGYPGTPSERKIRLFGCACLRHLDILFRHPDGPRCIAACERYADGEITRGTLQRWSRRAAALRYAATVAGQTDMAQWYAATHLMEACGSGWVFTADWILRPEESKPFGPEFFAGARERFTHFLRDVFGNLFRPVRFSPHWRTDAAVALAKQMYQSREFDAMPILADALQEAGCDDERLLEHCHAPGPHVRGCWAVDLVLAKA